MTINPRIKFTVRDYMATPEDTRYELIEGELVVSPSPNTEHQRRSFRMARLLSEFVETAGLGEVLVAPMDVILSEHDVFQPDILFISRARASIVTDRVRGVPDLVVEVLSPGSEERDRVLKRTVYARYGVREYWIVDPEARTIALMELGEEGFREPRIYRAGDELTARVLPGLSLRVDQVFGTK